MCIWILYSYWGHGTSTPGVLLSHLLLLGTIKGTGFRIGNPIYINGEINSLLEPCTLVTPTTPLRIYICVTVDVSAFDERRVTCTVLVGYVSELGAVQFVRMPARCIELLGNISHWFY